MVSPLGIGTWAWGDRLYWGYGTGGYDESDLQQAFDDTLRAGINFFDTAEVYGFGSSEKFIGKFRQTHPLGDTVRVGTKFFPLPYRLTRGFLIQALRGSLKRLRLERVDLYQMHSPLSPVSIETWMDGMAEAVERALARAVGVSNYSADQVRRAHARLAKYHIPLASNQIEYNLLHRAPDFNGVTDTCRELGVTVIAYSPLKYGLLTGKYSPSNPPPGARRAQFSKQYLARIQPFLGEVRAIAQARGKTLPQIAVNWTMRHGALPIPGAKNARQADENAGALGWELTEDETARLDELSERLYRQI